MEPGFVCVLSLFDYVRQAILLEKYLKGTAAPNGKGWAIRGRKSHTVLGALLQMPRASMANSTWPL